MQGIWYCMRKVCTGTLKCFKQKIIKINSLLSYSDFQLVNVLGDPVETRSWNIYGLPNDSFSIESAIIMK